MEYPSQTAKVHKRHDVSKLSIYSWRKKFGNLGVDDVKCSRQLGQEIGRQQILAERDLGIEVMMEIAMKKWWERRSDWSRPAIKFSGASTK